MGAWWHGDRGNFLWVVCCYWGFLEMTKKYNPLPMFKWKLKNTFFSKFCLNFLAFLAFSFFVKMWKSIFQQEFGVHSTQTLVKIYNICFIHKIDTIGGCFENNYQTCFNTIFGPVMKLSGRVNGTSPSDWECWIFAFFEIWNLKFKFEFFWKLNLNFKVFWKMTNSRFGFGISLSLFFILLNLPVCAPQIDLWKHHIETR